MNKQDHVNIFFISHFPLPYLPHLPQSGDAKRLDTQGVFAGLPSNSGSCGQGKGVGGKRDLMWQTERSRMTLFPA